jgi:hypothetical protein
MTKSSSYQPMFSVGQIEASATSLLTKASDCSLPIQGGKALERIRREP